MDFSINSKFRPDYGTRTSGVGATGVSRKIDGTGKLNANQAFIMSDSAKSYGMAGGAPNIEGARGSYTQAERNEAMSKLFSKLAGFGETGALFSIYDLAALMQDAAQKIRNSMRDLRQLEMTGIQQTMKSQARMQKSAAITGAIIGGITCAVQGGMMIGSVVSQVKGLGQGKNANLKSGMDQANADMGLANGWMDKNVANANYNTVLKDTKIDVNTLNLKGAAAENCIKDINADFNKGLGEKQIGDKFAALSKQLESEGKPIAAKDAMKAADIHYEAANKYFAKADTNYQALTGDSFIPRKFNNLDIKNSGDLTVKAQPQPQPQNNLQIQNQNQDPSQPQIHNEGSSEIIGKKDPNTVNSGNSSADSNVPKPVDNKAPDQGKFQTEKQVEVNISDNKISVSDKTGPKDVKQTFGPDQAKMKQAVGKAYEADMKNANDNLGKAIAGGDRKVITNAANKAKVVRATQVKYASENLGGDEMKAISQDARSGLMQAKENLELMGGGKSYSSEKLMVYGMMANTLSQMIGQAGQTAQQTVQGFMQAEITKKGAEKEGMSEMLDQIKDLFANVESTVQKAIEVFAAVTQQEAQSINQIMA